MAGQGNDPARGLVDALATQFAEAVGTLIGKPPTIAPRAAAVDAAWIARIQVTGQFRGSVSIGLSAIDATAIARLVMGLEEDPPEPAVRDTLEELASQACGTTAGKPAGRDCQFTIEMVGRAESVPNDEPLIFESTFNEALKAYLAVWNTLSVVETVATYASGAVKVPGDNLDVILDIDLPMTVRFGETELPLHTIVDLGPGSVVDLGRSPDEPVEVLVSGKMVARGEVVVVGGNYGVRITEVISRVERIKQMGAS
ncbi:MAG TPA: flagellar motor switch protein FliN [Vicinamibacterales bacterium]